MPTGANLSDQEFCRAEGNSRQCHSPSRSDRWVAMSKRSRPGFLPHGLVILHEDQDILVVDKPAGLLTIGTESDKSRTAYFILTDYVRKGCARSRNRVFIVHRLDRETSGVLVFAKSEEAKLRLQGAVGRDGEEVSCRRSRPVPEERRRPLRPTLPRTKPTSCTLRPTPPRESCPVRPTECSSKRRTLPCWK